MKALPKIQQQGASDYLKGKPLNRNPWQYTSDIFKQAAWKVGWVNEERKAAKELNKRKFTPC